MNFSISFVKAYVRVWGNLIIFHYEKNLDERVDAIINLFSMTFLIRVWLDVIGRQPQPENFSEPFYY